MSVIALHGDLATASMLRRDMGDPAWVDYYFAADWGPKHFDGSYSNLVKLVLAQEQVILVGYSRGGSVIAKLSCDPEIPDGKIRGAVIYEGPIMDSIGCIADFPVLLIWNEQGALAGPRRARAIDSLREWSTGQATLMIGSGRHIRRDEDTNELGHGWDTSLNRRIKEWILSIG